MAEAAELDAGDPEVVAAIMTTQDAPEEGEGPREPVTEGDEPAPDDESPDEGDQEPSEKEDTRDEAEEEVEDEEKEVIEDPNVDDLLVAVTVNGQEVEIPLRELKQSYSGNKFIEQNIQKAVEVRKAVEYNAAVLYNANQEAAQKLKSLNAVLDTMTNPAIDWAALKARNPTEYVLKREEQREIQDKQRLVQQEVERIEGEQADLQAQARQRLVLDQATLLAERLPIMSDPKTAPVVMGEMVRTAEYFGFNKDEVGGVLDHRQMLVLYAATEWLRDQERRAQIHRKANGNGNASARAEQQSTPRKVLIRPGSSQNSAEGRQQRLTAEVYKRAQRTGSVEDVALTLLVPRSKQRR